MSYGFYLFKPPPGEDPLRAAHTRLEAETDVVTPTSLRIAARRNARLVEALIAHDPALRSVVMGAPPADGGGGSTSESEVRALSLMLDEPRGGFGIEVNLFDGMAAVKLPYWHTGARAEDALKKVWEYLSIIQREADYVVYDPQLDRILDLAHDLPAVLTAYEDAVASLRQIVANRSQ